MRTLTTRQGSFPPNFLWGSATSSHQVEGDNLNNDWWAWEQQNPERIRDGRPSGACAQWWRGRAEGDLEMARSLGHNAHRMSLEWSRIEPEPGSFSPGAVHRYRQILARGRDLGLSMHVTLNHFTLPAWVAKAGGWLAPDTVTRFGRYARHVAETLGDLVSRVYTINEPMVLAYKGYVQGMWPPGRRQPREAARCVGRQLDGHAAAHAAYKEVRPNTPVGLALNLPTIGPSRPEYRSDRWAARSQDWLINGVLLELLRTGRRWPPLSLRPELRPIPCSWDFIGINYYGAYQVRMDRGRRPRFVQEPTVATETADWGQPSGDAFEAMLKRLSGLGRPILVSENGLFDPLDELRPGYIRDHVRAVHRAIGAGAPVAGYFHWSLIDNFEWAQGWTTPFGLVALDPDTQERRIKPSAYVLRDIAQSNHVPA